MLQQLTKDRIDKFICELFIAAVDGNPSPFLFEQVRLESDLPSFTIKIIWDCDGKIADGIGHFADFTVENADGSWVITPLIMTFAEYCGLYHNYDREEPNWLGVADIEVLDDSVDIESQFFEMVTYGVELIMANAKQM